MDPIRHTNELKEELGISDIVKYLTRLGIPRLARYQATSDIPHICKYLPKCGIPDTGWNSNT